MPAKRREAEASGDGREQGDDRPDRVVDSRVGLGGEKRAGRGEADAREGDDRYEDGRLQAHAGELLEVADARRPHLACREHHERDAGERRHQVDLEHARDGEGEHLDEAQSGRDEDHERDEHVADGPCELAVPDLHHRQHERVEADVADARGGEHVGYLVGDPEEHLVHAAAKLDGVADEHHDERELDDDPDVVAGHGEVVAAHRGDLLGELEQGPDAREAEEADADRLDDLDRDVRGRRVHLGEVRPLAVEADLEQSGRRDALEHRLSAVHAEAGDALAGAIEEVGGPGPEVRDVEARLLAVGADHQVVVEPFLVAVLAVLDGLVVVAIVRRLELGLRGLGEGRRRRCQHGRGGRDERDRQHGRQRGAHEGRGARRAPFISR